MGKYDLLFVISKRLVAATHSRELRSNQETGTTDASPPLEKRYRWISTSRRLSLPDASHADSKYIATACQTAHFKSLYRKRSGSGLPRYPLTELCRSVSDTVIGLQDHNYVLLAV